MGDGQENARSQAFRIESGAMINDVPRIRTQDLRLSLYQNRGLSELPFLCDSRLVGQVGQEIGSGILTPGGTSPPAPHCRFWSVVFVGWLCIFLPLLKVV